MMTYKELAEKASRGTFRAIDLDTTPCVTDECTIGDVCDLYHVQPNGEIFIKERAKENALLIAHTLNNFGGLLEALEASRDLAISYGVSSAVLKIMNETIKQATEVKDNGEM